MAECKTCGFIDKTLPKEWTEWECAQCDRDTRRTMTNPSGRSDNKVMRWDGKAGYYPPDPDGGYFDA